MPTDIHGVSPRTEVGNTDTNQKINTTWSRWFVGWFSCSPTTLMQFVGLLSHLIFLQVVPRLLPCMGGWTPPLKMANVTLHSWAAPKVWWEPGFATVCSTKEKFKKGNQHSCWFSGSLSTTEKVLFSWNAPKIQLMLTTNSPHGKKQIKLNIADRALNYCQGSRQWGRYLICQFGKHISELCPSRSVIIDHTNYPLTAGMIPN